MKDLPRITLITPSFNQAQYLEACIDSILSQNYPNLEYLIIDGGSTDSSVDIIKKYSPHLAYWRSHPDEGPYAAANEGLKRATGEIMGWLNSDDMLHPHGLLALAQVFAERSDIEFLTGRIVNFDAHGNAWEAPIPLIRWCRNVLLARENFDERRFLTVTQETTFWRRSLWEKAGGSLDLSLKLAADFELWARFLRIAELHTVDAKIGGFRSHSEGQRSRHFIQDYKKECLHVIDREISLGIPYNSRFDTPPPIVSLSSSSKPEETQKPIFKPKLFKKLEINPGYPRISIVTICHNQERYLNQCIESVLTQGWQNLEYIVMDCASNDASLDIIKAYKDHLTILDNPQQLKGFNALNYALSHCSGDIMAWIYPEDKYHEKAFLQAAGILYRHPEIEWIIGRPNALQESGEPLYIDVLPAIYARRNWLEINVVQPFIYQESMFWKKSLWQRAGAVLNTQWKYAADFELWLRFSRYAELYSVNFLLAGYRNGIEGRYSRYPIQYLQEVVSIVEEEKRMVDSTPFDEKVPPVPILVL